MLNRIIIFALCSVFISGGLLASELRVTNLRTEYKINPLGIDTEKPRFSWEIVSDRNNTKQTAYEIRCAGSMQALNNATDLLWKSKQATDQSIQNTYEGPSLKSREKIFWQVRVWDNNSRVSEWSDTAWFEMGLLSESDWQAQWVEADIDENVEISQPANYFRNEFNLEKGVKSARMYITSRGLYEAFINGKRIGDQVFTPGWTSYNKRLQYQVYDITEFLQNGKNAIGVTVGDGWYRGYLAWVDKKNVYGEKLGLLAQLEVQYQDGSREIIISDKNWKATNDGPILTSDIYMGEIYDATKEMPGWTQPGFNNQWKSVIVQTDSGNDLVATYGPFVRKINELTPIEISPKKDDTFIFDMGQNMVGWVRLKINAPKGTQIQLRHAEVLDKKGNFYTENLRAAKQTVLYTCSGNGTEIFEPHFTFQGFRFVELSGFPGTPDKSTLTGVVIHSDMTPTGTFTCSDSLINQLQHNIQWGLKGNFIDVPTDCPQRDERLGWTGDAQVFAPTACYNVDAATFYTKWLKDLALDQGEDGKSMDVIPDVLKGSGAHTGWADAAVIVPWVVYLNYGDKRVLENQYASMKAWVNYMRNKAGEDYLWTGDWHYGDWLSFNNTGSDYPGAYTETDLIASAYFAYSSTILSKTAAILGNNEDAAEFKNLSEKIKSAFQEEFLTPNGRLVSHTQTAYTLALSFGLLPDAMKIKAGAYLNENVQRFNHITTGFLGTPLICQILTDYGYLDTAFMLLNRKEYPSWLYPVTKGATTIWERWDGMRPDSSFQDVGMNSFNHYAYGAIGKWLYSTVAGIDIDENKPGYKNIIFNPHPGGGLTFAKAEINTMYGTALSEWHLEKNTFSYKIVVPANTTAQVYLPASDHQKVLINGKSAEQNDSIKLITEGNQHYLTTGSGSYEFELAM
ncbi:MAG: glycoside hydrolase family 78 protein [Calditrichaeota bacterium]|nr:glycoside hydrolase family 78 protein [Calditrichota bacterium]